MNLMISKKRKTEALRLIESRRLWLDIPRAYGELRGVYGRGITLNEVEVLCKEVATGVLPVPPVIHEHKAARTSVVREELEQRVAELVREGLPFATKPREGHRVPGGLSALLLLSDLHVGEVVHQEGVEVYNRDLAFAAIDRVVGGFIHAPELVGYTVDEAVVVLGGDLIDGTGIFPSQAQEGTIPVFHQFEATLGYLFSKLREMAHHFPVVRVYGVPGNHGRVSKDAHPMSNFEVLLLMSLQLMFSVATDLISARVEINCPRDMYQNFDVRDWRFHCRHIAPKTNTNTAQRTHLAWGDMHGADVILFGHHHVAEQFASGAITIFKNGSLVPRNSFAESHGLLGAPGQWMLGITDNHSVAFSKVLHP
jgi:predicted phosphodiesterase